MDKLAVIELNTTNIKLTFAYVIKNKSFLVYKNLITPINLLKDFDEDEIIKSLAIKEVISVLMVYKKMIESQGVTDVIAVASDFIKTAKNQTGFLNEIYSLTGFEFKVLLAQEEINYIYTAAINTLNKPKALIVNIGQYNTQFMLYNRRNIINSEIVPLGSVNLSKIEGLSGLQPEKKSELMTDHFSNLIKNFEFVKNLDEEYEVIGVGSPFLNVGNISRRAKKYPLDVEHNYAISCDDFNKVHDVIKPIDQTKTSKIRGVSAEDTGNLQAGMSIIAAIFNNINKQEISISKADKLDGLLLTYVIPLTIEKPISDNLGYSLQVINEYFDRKPNNSEHIYNLSMILFKQLKVLHKLSRSFVRVLRVASFLCAAGKRVDYLTHDKSCFNVIVNSNIYGISHSELVLSGFVATLRDPDNFNMAEWVKYRDLVSETDLDAVRKLAVIIKIAESLDATEFGNVTDINCDILGDSVIVKTVTAADASLEIKLAMTCSADFRKAFNKNLEIL